MDKDLQRDKWWWWCMWYAQMCTTELKFSPLRANTPFCHGNTVSGSKTQPQIDKFKYC